METWTYTWAVRNLVAELMMPPGIWVLGSLLVLFVLKTCSRLQKILIVAGLGLIWISATPIFSYGLMTMSQSWMGWPTPFQWGSSNLVVSFKKPQAIVVLGAGRRKGALESAEYSHQDLYQPSLERLRIGARLAHQTGLPILFSGGLADQTSSTDLPEAVVMGKVLEKEFHQKPMWLESQSQTTQENASYTAKILSRDNIQDIYLVTHFWHMPRAQMMFEKNGFRVVPVPHGYQSLDLRLN